MNGSLMPMGQLTPHSPRMWLRVRGRQVGDGRGLSNGVHYTVDEWCWEVPAGSVKDGQSIIQAAIEELHEEVGGVAREMAYIGRFFLANGICDEVGHIFLATGVVMGEPAHEAAEVIRVQLMPIDEALRMARACEITDGPTALALLLCAERLAALRPDGI